MHQHIPKEVLAFMAAKFHTLGDTMRLSILQTLIHEGERNVGQIVAATGGTQANVSKHLKLLAGAGMVARRRQGLNVLYKIDDPVVEKICELLCDTILKELRQQGAKSRALTATKRKDR